MRIADVVCFQRLNSTAVIPSLANPDDAGFDLYSNVSKTVLPGERALIPTGVACAIPEGCVGLVCPRSGLAVHSGLTVLNAPGIIDSGYRGELKVLLYNTSKHGFRVEIGMRIAQLVITNFTGNWRAVDTLPYSQYRGASGFGSTGI